jgi:hypothetical protein
MALYLCVLIVFSFHQESFKLILVDEPLLEGVLSYFTAGHVSHLALMIIWAYFSTVTSTFAC